MSHKVRLTASTALLSHAVADAPLAEERPSYPVLVQSQSGFPPLLLAAIGEPGRGWPGS
jgi:hypothetical protein